MDKEKTIPITLRKKSSTRRSQYKTRRREAWFV